MIQRIQTVYLILATVSMAVCAAVVCPFGVLLTAASAVAALLSLCAVFLYRRRLLQAAACRILCVAGVAIATVAALWRPQGAGPAAAVWAAAAAAAAAVLWFLAHRAVMKDEKLVRSLDRIR